MRKRGEKPRVERGSCLNLSSAIRLKQGTFLKWCLLLFTLFCWRLVLWLMGNGGYVCVWVCFCFCLCVDSNSYNSISMCTLTHRIPSGDGEKRRKKKKDLRWERLLFMRRKWVIIWAVGLYCFHFLLLLFAFTIEINALLCTGITDFDSFRKGLFQLLFLCFLYIDAITHQ